MPKVSIIIPVYNTGQYLRECLDSVLVQTLPDLEIICVNDGSTDGSADTLENYRQKNRRIKIITQTNQGLSAARNAGLQAAQGKYVYFLDSDDFLAVPQALEILYKRCEQDELDVLYFDVKPVYAAVKIAVPYGDAWYTRAKEYPALTSGADLFTKMSQDNEYRCMAWLQFSRRDFLEKHQLRFYNGIYHEDNLFSLQCILLADRVAYLRAKFIAHRIRTENSIMATFWQDCRHLYGYLVCLRETTTFLQEKSFNPSTLSEINKLLAEYRHNIYFIYETLAPEEKLKIKNFSVAELALFEKTIYEYKQHVFRNSPQNTAVKLSVIIPIYNAASTLSGCLDSILRQSLKTVELLCVNDGSADDSLRILQDYARRNQNIIIIDQTQQGSGPARNHGLSLARGEYVAFVDADDYLLSNTALTQILALADEKKADIVSANFKYWQNNSLQSCLHMRRYSEQAVISAVEYGIPWYFFRNIYRRSFLAAYNIQFPAYLRGQDAVFLAACLANVDYIYIIPQDLYVYRTPVKSKLNTPAKRIDYIKHFIAVFKLLNKTKFYATISQYETYLGDFFLNECPPSEIFNYVSTASGDEIIWVKYFEYFLAARIKAAIREQKRIIDELRRQQSPREKNAKMA